MIEIKRNFDREEFVFEAKSGGEFLAEIGGEITEGVFLIKSYAGDETLFDGMVRSALNGADHAGAKSALFAESIDGNLLKKNGYHREIESILRFFGEE